VQRNQVSQSRNGKCSFLKGAQGRKQVLQMWYVDVINDGGEMVTTEVAHKQLRYMSITPQLKRLFLSKRTTIHMWWHKDGE
jgi:hypothetical protein